jgi:hypothetical protein
VCNETLVADCFMDAPNLASSLTLSFPGRSQWDGIHWNIIRYFVCNSVAGEYVALYQQQRGVLQQRAAEKDLEMARMAADREQMRQKLQRVGHLVSVLVSPLSLETTTSPGQCSFWDRKNTLLVQEYKQKEILQMQLSQDKEKRRMK